MGIARYRSSRVIFFIPVLLFFLWGGAAEPQERYPGRAIDIIVPFSAGGGTDLVNRVMANYLKARWGTPVNIINKPGGNTVPACVEIYSARPDGYTVLGDSSNSTSMLAVAVKSLPFNIMDRSFIASVSMLSFVFAVSPTSPFKSLEEVAADAKRDPGNFTWTSLGGASTHDFAFRQFFKAIGVDVSKTKAIMSQGGSQAVTLTAGGHVKLGGGTTPSCFAGIKGGIIRPLAITSRTRYPDLPEVPTTGEQGYPTVSAQAWFGPSGPPNLSPGIIEVWEKALQEMVKDPEVITKWRNVGATPFYLSARDAREYILKELSEMKQLWDIK